MSKLDDLDEGLDLPDDVLESQQPVVVPHVMQKQPQKVPSAPAPKPDKEPDKPVSAEVAPVTEKPARKPWKLSVSENWKPVTVAAMVLTVVFALGVLYGIVLSGHVGLYPYLLSSPAAVVLSPLEAPAGVVLLLFASIFAFLRGKDAENPTMWNIAGWLLLLLFVAGMY